MLKTVTCKAKLWTKIYLGLQGKCLIYVGALLILHSYFVVNQST